MIYKYILLLYRLLFHYVDGFICAEAFKFDVISFIFTFVACTFGVISQKNYCQDHCEGDFFFPKFSSGSFMVSGLMFKSLIHFELIFMSGIGEG